MMSPPCSLEEQKPDVFLLRKAADSFTKRFLLAHVSFLFNEDAPVS